MAAVKKATTDDYALMSAEDRAAIKGGLQDALLVEAIDAQHEWVTEVRCGDDVSEKRRLVEFMWDRLDLAVPKKQDANAGLPIINFTTNYASAAAPVSVRAEIVDASGSTVQTIEFTPTTAMRANLAVNKDLTDEIVDI